MEKINFITKPNNTIKRVRSIVEVNVLAEAISDGAFKNDSRMMKNDDAPVCKETRNITKLLQLFLARIFVIHNCETISII